MIYIITGNLTAGSKVVAQALMNGLASATFEVDGYEVEPNYGDTTKMWKVKKDGETVWKFSEFEEKIEGMSDETITKIREKLATIKPSAYQSKRDRYYYDAMLLKGDKSLYDDKATKAIVHNTLTLRQDFRSLNTMTKDFDDAILVSNIAGAELENLKSRFKDITVIHIQRNPLASYCLRDFTDTVVNDYEGDYPDDKIVTSMLSHLTTTKNKDITVLKFEEMMKNNYFDVNGVRYTLDNNLEPFNEYFTKWEAENKDLSVNLDSWPEVKESLVHFNTVVNEVEQVEIDLPENIIEYLGYDSEIPLEDIIKK